MLFRSHGISRDAWKRYGTSGYAHWEILAPGHKFNMFDLQGTLALTQLAKIERFYERRVALKARLDAGLRDVPGLTFPAERPDRRHAFHLYPVIVRVEELTTDRDTVMNAIQAERIGVGVHFRAVHLHPYYQQTFGFTRGMFPNAEYYSDRTISLPLHPRLSEADVDDVIAAVRKVVVHYRR